MANVLEIPIGAAITRHQGLPLFQGRCRIEPSLRQPRLRGQIGEGQTFTGKGDIGAAGIFQRPAIGADAVIMADALIDALLESKVSRLKRAIYSAGLSKNDEAARAGATNKS